MKILIKPCLQIYIKFIYITAKKCKENGHNQWNVGQNNDYLFVKKITNELCENGGRLNIKTKEKQN